MAKSKKTRRTLKPPQPLRRITRSQSRLKTKPMTEEEGPFIDLTADASIPSTDSRTIDPRPTSSLHTLAQAAETLTPSPTSSNSKPTIDEPPSPSRMFRRSLTPDLNISLGDSSEIRTPTGAMSDRTYLATNEFLRRFDYSSSSAHNHTTRLPSSPLFSKTPASCSSNHYPLCYFVKCTGRTKLKPTICFSTSPKNAQTNTHLSSRNPYCCTPCQSVDQHTI